MVKVTFHKWDPHKVFLSREEAQDIVELLFRGDKNVWLYGEMQEELREKHELIRGHHEFLQGGHVISLDGSAIVTSISQGDSVGGTIFVRDRRLGSALVLAHEIQHANQRSSHSATNREFWGTQRSRYMNRASERDARRFADEHIKILAQMLEVSLEDSDERLRVRLRPLVQLLQDADESLTIAELLQEMISLGMGDGALVERGVRYFKTLGLLREG